MKKRTFKEVENDEIREKLFEILNEETSRNEIRILLKLAEDSGKRITYSELLSVDKMYKKQAKDLDVALKRYENLNLTEDQKDIVDDYVSKLMLVNFECTQNAYAAGILDGYKILRALGVTNE